ncbi:hypothetical protein DVA67_000045 [Solirubrobacter sp. CPCC 204708]|uniref:Uncharacterized protein n=1 Tax=Solirubrobacter deserti TaxID=2282478 RepID=A0ABT4RT75_9ACTN|nr:hypothetical protein [Solirubrobacter deserti]MBE2314347.1 hypothetical protein [Solirubrobacter deserti]MDA0141445.1 hypothetical protein [Solirubrobacter deserti]
MNDERVIDHLVSLRELEPSPAQAARLRAANVRRRRSLRKALALALVLVAGTSTLATALIADTSGPRPPARVVEASVPADATQLFGALRRPASPAERSTAVRTVVSDRLGAPYVVEPSSIRAVGTTPLGDAAYLLYARMDGGLPDRIEGVAVVVDGLGSEGPYPLEDVRRGVAWGVHGERLMTVLVPDGVASVRVTLDDGTRAAAPVRDNVAFMALDARAPVATVRWLDPRGEIVATHRF